MYGYTAEAWGYFWPLVQDIRPRAEFPGSHILLSFIWSVSLPAWTLPFIPIFAAPLSFVPYDKVGHGLLSSSRTCIQLQEQAGCFGKWSQLLEMTRAPCLWWMCRRPEGKSIVMLHGLCLQDSPTFVKWCHKPILGQGNEEIFANDFYSEKK